MPRQARLQRREQFAAALAAGSSGARRHFRVFATPNGVGRARLGIIVSKKAAPRAVDRNRAKRLVREIFRTCRHRLAGVDLVVQLRRCPPPGASARAELLKLLTDIAPGRASDAR